MTVKQMAERYGRSEQTIRHAIKKGAIPDAYYTGGKRSTYIIGDRDMYFSNDPIRDFERWDAEQERKLARLPICKWCGEPCQGEKALHINNDWMCERCMDEYGVYLDDLED